MSGSLPDNAALTALRHRQRAQVVTLFPALVLFMIASIAIAVDLVVFNLVRSELQKATDAAALAAVRYAPACPDVDLRCLRLVPEPSTSPPDPACTIADPVPDHQSSCTVATSYFGYNAALASALCQPAPTTRTYVGSAPGGAGNVGRNIVTVTATCDAWYLTGRVFGLTWISINVSSTAGLFQNDGQVKPYSVVSNGTDPSLIQTFPLLAARLVS
jgi:hypothetical protein